MYDQGYDTPLIKIALETVTVPVIALCSAGSLSHMQKAYVDAFANGLDAGSMFVDNGAQSCVLLNYPDSNEI